MNSYQSGLSLPSSSSSTATSKCSKGSLWGITSSRCEDQQPSQADARAAMMYMNDTSSRVESTNPSSGTAQATAGETHHQPESLVASAVRNYNLKRQLPQHQQQQQLAANGSRRFSASGPHKKRAKYSQNYADDNTASDESVRLSKGSRAAAHSPQMVSDGEQEPAIRYKSQQANIRNQEPQDDGSQVDLEKKRLASRLSSRRTREREANRIKHFQGLKETLASEKLQLQQQQKELKELLKRAKAEKELLQKQQPSIAPTSVQLPVPVPVQQSLPSAPLQQPQALPASPTIDAGVLELLSSFLSQPQQQQQPQQVTIPQAPQYQSNTNALDGSIMSLLSDPKLSVSLLCLLTGQPLTIEQHMEMVQAICGMLVNLDQSSPPQIPVAPQATATRIPAANQVSSIQSFLASHQRGMQFPPSPSVQSRQTAPNM